MKKFQSPTAHRGPRHRAARPKPQRALAAAVLVAGLAVSVGVMPATSAMLPSAVAQAVGTKPAVQIDAPIGATEAQLSVKPGGGAGIGRTSAEAMSGITAMWVPLSTNPSSITVWVSYDFSGKRAVEKVTVNLPGSAVAPAPVLTLQGTITPGQTLARYEVTDTGNASWLGYADYGQLIWDGGKAFVSFELGSKARTETVNLKYTLDGKKYTATRTVNLPAFREIPDPVRSSAVTPASVLAETRVGYSGLKFVEPAASAITGAFFSHYEFRVGDKPVKDLAGDGQDEVCAAGWSGEPVGVRAIFRNAAMDGFYADSKPVVCGWGDEKPIYWGMETKDPRNEVEKSSPSIPQIKPGNYQAGDLLRVYRDEHPGFDNGQPLNGPLTFQWKVDGKVVKGATGSTFKAPTCDGPLPVKRVTVVGTGLSRDLVAATAKIDLDPETVCAAAPVKPKPVIGDPPVSPKPTVDQPPTAPKIVPTIKKPVVTPPHKPVGKPPIVVDRPKKPEVMSSLAPGMLEWLEAQAVQRK
jgi:hypothetical protein